MKKSGALPELLEALEEFLARGLPQAEVTTDYPWEQRRLPLDRAVVWLGVEKITALGGDMKRVTIPDTELSKAL